MNSLRIVFFIIKMVFEQNLCKANLGELYVITNKLDSANYIWTRAIASFPESGINRRFIT